MDLIILPRVSITAPVQKFRPEIRVSEPKLDCHQNLSGCSLGHSPACPEISSKALRRGRRGQRATADCSPLTFSMSENFPVQKYKIWAW